MKWNRQNLRGIGRFLLAAVFFITVPVMAKGEEGASITVFYHGVTQQEESVALPNAGFSLYRIGAYQEGSWELQEPFDKEAVSLEDMSASGQLRAARKIYAYIKAKKIKGVLKATEDNGYTAFTGLEEGLYLIAPAGDVSYEGGVFRSAPFLACIPETDENGNAVYDIKVEPKNEWVSDREEPEEPETQAPSTEPVKKPGKGPEKKPGSSQFTNSNVKTGDEAPLSIFAGMLAASGSALLLLEILKKRKERQ